MQTAGREPILILDENRGERSAIAGELGKAGISSAQCADLRELCKLLQDGAPAAIVAPDGLNHESLEPLASALRNAQDRRGPSLLLIAPGDQSDDPGRFGTPLVIERPLQLPTLVSWARAALQAAEREHRTLSLLKEQTSAAQRVSDELAERKADLRRANLDLEQFIFSASHEFREPLRSLAIYSEKLRRFAGSALDEEIRQCLSIVLASAERMEMLFRDLLAFIQVSTPAPVHVEVDTNAVLDNVLAKFQSLILKTGAVIQADALPPLCVSELHLSKLFEHLIENAIKYRLPGAEPQIRIFAQETHGESIICVRDNGLGIAPQHQHKVFGLFQRLHTSAEYEGTGLGLAICQKIAEQNQGRISVKSELGQGATFCFALPRRSDAKHAWSAASA